MKLIFEFSAARVSKFHIGPYSEKNDNFLYLIVVYIKKKRCGTEE